MPSYNKILFPIDFSSGSAKIVPDVKEIADKFESDVHIVFVVHVRHYYEGVGLQFSYVVDFEDEVVKQAKKQLQQFIATHFKDRSVTSKIVSGYPGEEILKYVQTEGIDLIIMGHSKKGIKRMVMGSVAGYVVKKSHVPVLIVNPDEETSV